MSQRKIAFSFLADNFIHNTQNSFEHEAIENVRERTICSIVNLFENHKIKEKTKMEKKKS
jgi:hypothetical protein